MSKKNNSDSFWLEKLLIPIVVGIALAGSAPWWYNEFFKRNTATVPALGPTPPSSATPESPSTPTSWEIRKQDYIFQLQGCHTTGEVGAIVCDFTVEAESERKDLSLIGRNTILVDSDGQSHRASRMDFGSSGSSTSARSNVLPGAPIRGTASFSGVSSGIIFFPAFKLGGYSYGDGNLTVTFNEIPLTD